MFGKKKDVVSEGVQAKAVILAAHPGNYLIGHGERKWHVQIRVQ